jgi:hypothetical protein
MLKLSDLFSVGFAQCLEELRASHHKSFLSTNDEKTGLL